VVLRSGVGRQLKSPPSVGRAGALTSSRIGTARCLYVESSSMPELTSTDVVSILRSFVRTGREVVLNVSMKAPYESPKPTDLVQLEFELPVTSVPGYGK
jgi:hypothetical protein